MASQSQKQLTSIVEGFKPIYIRAELFKKGNFDFICTRPDENGDIKTHLKMQEAFEILTSNDYEEFLYGGGAGSGKSWCGCSWLLFMCINYPGTKYFVARNELKDIVDSVLVTWSKVCKKYGFTDWKFNAVKNFIQIGNGSHINFIELKYKPSDTLFESVGSTEYTSGWVEEVSEISEIGVDVISSRVGRHLNKKYNIKGTVFMTTNPKKNWIKTRFYDRWKTGSLDSKHYYLPALIIDNPFIEHEYIEKLRRMSSKNKELYERLFKGNWDYSENPDALCDYAMIEQIFQNDHVGKEEDTHYITADIARMGSDKAVILVWKGWKVIDIKTYDVSATTEISYAIDLFRRKYQIPKNFVVVDADGIGASIVDQMGALPFINNAKPIKEKGDMPNYRNLQVQCLYRLADKVNEGGIWIACDLTGEEKEEIKAELDQIQSRMTDYGKLDCKPKSEIKRDIGRSPDYRDALFMRVYFDIYHTEPIIYRTDKTLAELGIPW